MQNGGSDPNGSGFIFHFREFGDVMDCRDSMSIAVPAAFHFSIEVTNRFNAPPEVPMASVWIIIKTAVLSTDYREDFKNSLEAFLLSVVKLDLCYKCWTT